MNIYLVIMTKSLSRQFFQDFHNDPDIFMDCDSFSDYVYCEEAVDERWQRQKQLGRIHLAVMLEEEPVGEILFKDIHNGEATLSIHMKNDRFKNRGYGTNAELLALDYAFNTLELNTVFADAIHKNKRSQHVLEKVGFVKTHRDERFVYYRCDKEARQPPEPQKAEAVSADALPE